jgi:uncharacterized protein YdhG (YjbR/CyaY superfamily)
MKNETKHFSTLNEYLNSIEQDIRERLRQICDIVSEIEPQAEAKISYNMPAYFYNGRLIYFCAFKNHIGFYPASMKVFSKFQNELKKYKQSGRGTVQFPHDKPLPNKLIRQIVEYRVKENEVIMKKRAAFLFEK